MRDYGGLVFWMDAGDIIEEDFGRTWNEVAERGLLGIAVGGPVNLYVYRCQTVSMGDLTSVRPGYG